MAIWLRRWALAALIVCAGAACFRGRQGWSPEGDAWTTEQSRSHLASLRLQLARAERWLARLELRDSLLDVLRRDPSLAGQEPALLVSAELPPALQDTLRQIARLSLAALPENPKYRPVVAIEGDTTGQWYGRSLYFLPAATGGTVCLAAHYLNLQRTDAMRSDAVLRMASDGRLLGPCAYFAAFGQPGPQVRAWLEATHYAPANAPSWAWLGPPDTAHAGLLRSLQGLTPHELADAYLIDPLLVACAAGNIAGCRAAVLTPTWVPFTHINTAYDPALRGIELGAPAWWPLDVTWLPFFSDLVSEMGEERFARFWSSPLSVDSAFAEAFGAPLGEWTMAWAREEFGRPRSGPLAYATGALPALLIAGALLGCSVVLVGRRQVK